MDSGSPVLDHALQANLAPSARDLQNSTPATRAAVARQCRAVASVLLARGAAVAAEKEAMESDAEAALDGYSNRVDAFIAKVKEHRYENMKRAKAVSKARAKAFEAEIDAMTVSAAQLETRAVVCETAGDVLNSVAVSEAFSVLARKPVESIRIHVEFDADPAFLPAATEIQTVPQVSCVARLLLRRFKCLFVSQVPRAEDIEAALGLCAYLKTRISYLDTCIDVDALKAAVRHVLPHSHEVAAAYCDLVHTILRCKSPAAASFVAGGPVGAVALVLKAMTAWLENPSIQWTGALALDFLAYDNSDNVVAMLRADAIHILCSAFDAHLARDKSVTKHVLRTLCTLGLLSEDALALLRAGRAAGIAAQGKIAYFGNTKAADLLLTLIEGHRRPAKRARTFSS